MYDFFLIDIFLLISVICFFISLLIIFQKTTLIKKIIHIIKLNIKNITA